MTIDPKQREIRFPQATKITEIIQRVVLASEYCVSKLKKEALDDKGMVSWFRIDVQIQLLEFDPIRNVRAKKYIYRVVPFKVSGAIFQNPSSATPGGAALERIIAKRYDYLYTGQNNSILKFDLQFNGQFYTGISPTPLQNNANVSNKETNNVSEEKTPQARVQKGVAPESSTAVTGSAPTKPNPLLTFPSISGEKTVEQMVADNFNQSFTRSSDMVNVKIDIMGDLYFLSDSGLNSNYFADEGPNDQVKLDGSMNWEGSEIFIYITWRNPIEPNLGTSGQGGLYNFPPVEIFNPYSGIYKVIKCNNKFSDGKFTQTLEATRMPNQPWDYDPYKGASKNWAAFDISEADVIDLSPNSDYSNDVDYSDLFGIDVGGLGPGFSDEEIAQNNADLGDFEG
jgi:hypothetical protein